MSIRMNILEGSENVVINGAQFIAAREHHTHTQIITAAVDNGRRGLDLLHQRISPGAFHNSDERYDPPKCHPRTREAVLNLITNWVGDFKKANCFLWMYGPAGAGKSAIAQTIAERCHALGLLAAAFFFSRTAAGRNNKTSLVLTIVYQLCTAIPEIRENVGKAIERDPALLSKSLEAQIKVLFVDVLNSISSEVLLTRPRLIIIDGLDECNDAEAQEYILLTLSEAAQDLEVPVSFLVASRPEQQIRDAFNEDLLSSMTTTVILDDTFQPDEDIRTFLEDKFQMIKKKHPSRARFLDPWPTPSDIPELVRKSSGQFIYAATVMKYIESRKHLPPQRLQIIFGLTSTTAEDTPFAALDVVYLHIFASAGSLDKVIDLFYVLLLADTRMVEKIPIEIEKFLLYQPGEIDIVLSELYSILVVPAAEDPKGIIRISHASLSDFLRDRSRSGRFFIDYGKGYARITTLILKHIAFEVENWHDLSLHLFENGPKAQSTVELCDALYELDLATFLNWLSENVTPKRSNIPIVFWSKVSVDDRWPNIPAFLFWLKKHHHPNPNKDIEEHVTSAFDTWVATQLSVYPQMPGTTYLLTAVTLKDVYPKEHENTFIVINDGLNWDPADVSDMKKIDPLHFFDLYEGPGYAAVYYNDIANFLTDKVRAKEYYVGPERYFAFVKLLIEFLVREANNDVDKWWSEAAPVSSLLSAALALAQRSEDLKEYLTLSMQHLELSNKQLQIWAEVERVLHAIQLYLQKSAEL